MRHSKVILVTGSSGLTEINKSHLCRWWKNSDIAVLTLDDQPDASSAVVCLPSVQLLDGLDTVLCCAPLASADLRTCLQRKFIARGTDFLCLSLHRISGGPICDSSSVYS